MTDALHLAHLTTLEFAALVDDARPFVVLLPVGSVEPHGPHMALETDTVISYGAARRAARQLQETGLIARIAPSVPYGVTECASAFKGAVSIPGPVLTDYLRAVIAGFTHTGIDHVCLINNHLEPAQDQAVRAALDPFDDAQASVACPLTRRWARTLSREFKSGACHAGQYETSIMLAERPALVRDDVRTSLPEVPISLAEKLRAGVTDFVEMGLVRAYAGAPADASAEEGDDLLDRLATMVATQIREALATRPEPPSTPTYRLSAASVSIANTAQPAKPAASAEDAASAPASPAVIGANPDSILAVAISADGRIALSGSAHTDIDVWNVDTGERVRRLQGHTDWVRALALSKDGTRAVSGSDDKTVRVWNVTTGQIVHTLKGHTFWVAGVALSADGKIAVSGCEDRNLRVWDVVSGEQLRSLQGHAANVNAVAISADGTRAVSGSDDHTVRVWNIDTGAQIYTLFGHGDWVKSVALTPDGKTAVSGSLDRTLNVWDLTTGTLVRTLEGHDSWIGGVGIHADGTIAISGSLDGTVRVWQLSTGRHTATFTDHISIPTCALSGTGGRVVVGDERGNVRFLALHAQHGLSAERQRG